MISEEPKKEAPKKEKASEDEFDDEVEEEPVDLLHPHFQIDYGALSGVNADFTAVLHVPALSITYPVVKSKDNEEYLHRTFEGKANFAGSIFLDANAKGSYDHKNTFIFGHNMKNGTMFGKLKYFLRDDQLANSNPYVFLCRPEGITRYRIFSYYLTTVESPIYSGRISSPCPPVQDLPEETSALLCRQPWKRCIRTVKYIPFLRRMEKESSL